MVLKIFACVFSPRLYRIYSQMNFQGDIYRANIAETVGDYTISYLVPLGALFSVWQRKFNYFYILAVVIVCAYALRSAGRVLNPSYTSFLSVLQRATRSLNTESMEALRNYDFDFKYWPTRYKSTQRVVESMFRDNESGLIGWGAGWLMAHTIGIRLIYPGLLFGPILRSTLEESRAKFVIGLGASRNRIDTRNGNRIDSIFFDRRELKTERGKILVICCEGNAGYYEIGIVGTPLEMGYSVLGFNHPGFGGSSGKPYPEQELEAAESIFDFAINELGFAEGDIVLNGWSIGAYPAAYLAAVHPGIKGLILDATFDDILPLALPRMPEFMSPLVVSTIRNHVDLRVAKEVRKYPGPIRLIRRIDDEIIADPPGLLIANRGNYLLLDIIHTRYPALFENNPDSDKLLADWLKVPHDKNSKANDTFKTPLDVTTLSKKDQANLAVSIAENLLLDFKSTHCIPLSTSHFQLPWSDWAGGYKLN